MQKKKPIKKTTMAKETKPKQEVQELQEVQEVQESPVQEPILQMPIQEVQTIKQEPKKIVYTPHPLEKNIYHIRIEKVAYNPTTGQKISTPYVQKFHKREFELFEKNAISLGYTYTILYKPL